MKRVKKLAVLFLTLLFCCCAFLTGCGNKELEVGDVFKFQSLTYTSYGTDNTVSVGQKYNGVELTEESFVVFIVDEDRAVLRVQEDEEDFSADLYSYTLGYNENEYYIWSGFSELVGVATYDGDSLSLSIIDSSMSIYFVKE